MKRLTFIMFLAVAFASCKSEPTRVDIIRTNLEPKLLEVMNNPDSYEFVSLQYLDSTVIADNIRFRKEMFSERVKTAQRFINQNKELYTGSIAHLYDESKEEPYKKQIEENQKTLAGIDSLEQLLVDRLNEPVSYTYLIKFRGTNGFGAKVLNSYYVQTGAGPEYRILNITDDEKELHLAPAGFPGYIEMIMAQRETAND